MSAFKRAMLEGFAVREADSLALNVLGDATRIDEVLARGEKFATDRDPSKYGNVSKAAVGIKTLDAALSARRQQREGMGTGAQSQAVRRALSMAKNRQGGTAGSGDDPGRKNVLGGGL